MLLWNLFRAAFEVLCQLRINIMNAPAAVTPMTMMAATVKTKYATGMCLHLGPSPDLGNVHSPGGPVNQHGTSQSPLATSSLNELRLDVKRNHDLRREQ
jgi:hypothetical protein